MKIDSDLSFRSLCGNLSWCVSSKGRKICEENVKRVSKKKKSLKQNKKNNGEM